MASDLAVAGDNHEVGQTGKSLLDSVVDTITKGGPVVGLSVYNSFVNTGIEVANFFGAEIELNDPRKQLAAYDDNLYRYYDERASGVEVGGLIVGSLIPGTIGAKVVRAFASSGKFGANIARATNLMSRDEAVVTAAKAEFNLGTSGIYGQIQTDKWKTIAAGFGEQALEAAAFEAATIATLKANPTISKDGLADITSHMFWGTLVGGGVGGVIQGFGIRGLVNKALVTKDLEERAYDLATRMGIGDFVAGDRVVQLIQSIDNIPTPTTASTAAKLQRTKFQAEIEAMKILKTISPEADENLGAAFIDVLKEMRNKHAVSNEEMYDMFGRLSRISRVDQFSHLEQDIVYISSGVKKAVKAAPDYKPYSARPLSQEEADLSFAYNLTSREAPLKIARFDDTTYDPSTGAIRKYPSMQKSFDAGEDIWMDANLEWHINPKSSLLVRIPRPGESRILYAKEEKVFRATQSLPSESKPLYGAPLYFNLLSGQVTNRAHAVFGDLGPIKSVDDLLTHDATGAINGVRNGNFSSQQFVGTGYSYKDLSTIDANSRYIWAHLRKLQDGDIINFNDIPLLEQLRYEVTTIGRTSANKATIRTEDNRVVKATEFFGIRDENLLPAMPTSDLQFLDTYIQNTKNSIIGDLINAEKAAEEIAIKANVPLKYLDDGLVAAEYKDFTRPIADYLRTNTIRLEYDIGSINTNEGNILRGMLDVDKRVQLAQEQASNATAHFFGREWEEFIIPASASEAEITGVGNRAFATSNSSYGNIGQRAEAVGASVQRLTQKRFSALSDRFSNEIAALTDDAIAGAELAVLTNLGRRISRQYVFIPPTLAAQYKLSLDTIVLRESLRRDQTGAVISWNPNYMPNEGNWISGAKFNTLAPGETGAFTYMSLNDKVAKFLRTSTELNNGRLSHHNNWLAAQGISKHYDLDTVYFPPVDTTKYKYVAIVREIDGKGMGTSDAAALVADTAEGLRAKVAQLGEGWKVTFKDNSKAYHEALGDYDYALNLVESTVDSTLRKKGVLSDVFPKVRGEEIIGEYFNWHKRQEVRLIRNYLELGNAQLFAELRALGQKFVEVETSTAGVVGIFKRQIQDPFNQYIKTALNIGEKAEYRLWQETQDKAEAFFGTAFRMAKETFGQAQKGLISYEQANAITQKFGLGNPYGRAMDYMQAYAEANKLPITSALSQFTASANSIIAATTIRLDWFQTLINVVSTPVLQAAEYTSAKKIPALKELLTTPLPGSPELAAPAYTKALYNAIANIHGTRKQELLEWAEHLNVVNVQPRAYYEMLDNLTVAGSETASVLSKKAQRAAEIGAKLTGSDWAEQYTRLVSFDVARQLFEAKGYLGRELDDNIRTFINRVHGNYIASQRPVAFQGPIGAAVGLFQTYQFNLLQQLFRYIENKEVLPQAMLFGIQGTLFGMQGLPGFHALNTHIVGNATNNPTHKDFYSTTPQLFDKNLGDWLLYGSVSNFLSTGLYSRGDINPRQITILPINPLDYPAISGGIKFVKNLFDITERIKDGGKFSDTLLQGLEHNGISRPLTGLAQAVQGYTTTSKGSLISAANDWSAITYAARFAGARPLDEAITMDAMYRKTAYEAKDDRRLAQLGEAVKTNLIGLQEPDAETIIDFASRYAASGGRIENFSRKMIEWTRDANESVANKVYRQLKNPQAQNMMTIMGGQPLPDYFSRQNLAPASTQ